MEKSKKEYLGIIESADLVSWIKQHKDSIEKQTDQVSARLATAALGFEVNSKHIESRRLRLGMAAKRTLRPKPAPTNAETSDTIRRCHQAINTLVTHLEGNGWLDNAEATGLRDTIRRDLYGKGEAA